MIDATFATPFNQRPLEFGIDLVLHSATKYLGGHNDLLAGAVLGSEELVDGIRSLQHVTGAIIDPLAAYLLVRGLKTFGLRIARQNANAQGAGGISCRPSENRRGALCRLAEPSRTRHRAPANARLRRRGVLRIRGDLDATSRVVDGCRIPQIAPSLGGVESLIEQPALMSFYELSTEERLMVGIKDNLIRYSVGIEDTADLIADLAAALENV